MGLSIQALSDNTTAVGGEHEELSIHDGIDPLFIGLLSVVALFIGVLIRLALRKLPIPYTLLCLLFGLMLGEIAFQYDLAGLGNSIDAWINLDPHTILFLFLPPLIFERYVSLTYLSYHPNIVQVQWIFTLFAFPYIRALCWQVLFLISTSFYSL